MSELNRQPEQEPTPNPQDAMERLYDRVAAEHPDWGMDLILDEVDRLLALENQPEAPATDTESSPVTDGEEERPAGQDANAELAPGAAEAPLRPAEQAGDASLSSGPVEEAPRAGARRYSRPPMWAIALLAVVVVSVAIIVALFVIRPDLSGFRSEPLTPTLAPTAAAPILAFAPGVPTEVAAGQSIELPLALTDTVGEAGPGEDVTVAVEPETAGAVVWNDSRRGVTFTPAAGASGAARIVVRAADDSVLAEHTLNIREAPQLTVKAVAEQAETRLGEPLSFRFLIHNNGATAVENVTLEVNTPPGLALDLAKSTGDKQGCSETDMGVSCLLGTVSGGSIGAASITLYYSASEPGEASLAPDQYWLTFAGGKIVPTSDIQSVNVLGPSPTTLALEPAQSQLRADGVMTTTLRAAVADQWGNPYTGSARVQISLSRMTDASLNAAPIECQVHLTAQLQPAGGGATTPIDLADGEALTVVAYDEKSERLFVRTANSEGWIPRQAENQQTTTCFDSGLDPTSLPTAPESSPPDGTIPTDPLEIAGVGTFAYVAGGRPGEVAIAARLLGEQDEAVGQPITTTITLLEPGRLRTQAHARDSAEHARDRGSDGIVITQLPVGTPLELYPPDPASPGVRQAAIRIWTPATTLATDGATLLTDRPTVVSKWVAVGGGREDTLNRPPPDDATDANSILQEYGESALGYNVQSLGVTEGDRVLVRLIVWFHEDEIDLGP